jgi:hypothetical protein
MNTAVIKFSRVVRIILLPGALQTHAMPSDRPFSRRELQTLHCVPTLPPKEFAPRLWNPAVFCREIHLLAFRFTGAA